MNILFLSLSQEIIPKNGNSLYGSVLYELSKNNKLFIISQTERRNKENTHIIVGKNYNILKVRTGNITKTNIIEKGISTILIETQFKNAIKKYFKNIKFDLILYATPPITFCNTIKFFKRRDNARSYLMLKDIFPQNAVDLKIFSKNSIFYKFFRKKEIDLYNLSDSIGCMSPKNKKYLLEHNNYLDEDKVELFPNSINIDKNNIRNISLNNKYRKKYNIPLESKVFMYGGNLGKPQGIDFVIECFDKVKNIKNSFFVICGSGTEFYKIKNYIDDTKPHNLLLINGLPQREYIEFLNVADVGLIFLDYNFTIPNFPSRILSYMEKGIPILSCTDPNTDVGDVIENNGFGWKCYSNDSKAFEEKVKNISMLDNSVLKNMGNNGLSFLKINYNSNKNIKKIISLD